MISEFHYRQQTLLPVEKLDEPIHVIGCGSVGSWTATILAKMGASRLWLWDDDEVSAHNVGNQAFGPSDVGRLKVETLKRFIHEFSGQRTTALPQKCLGLGLEGKVAIFAVDSMDARIEIWNNLENVEGGVEWVIDSRMAAEVGYIYAVNLASEEDKRAYRDTLYTSREAVQAPCTAASTCYCAAGLASFITAQVKNIVLERDVPRRLAIDFTLMEIHEHGALK